MKKLTFYEQVGILIPGGLLLFGLIYLADPTTANLTKDGMSVGQFGIFLMISYALGHLVASLGNIIEKLFWLPFGGMPSDWIVKKNSNLISDLQLEKLREKLKSRLGLAVEEIVGMSLTQWRPISREIYADIHNNGKRDRLDSFNANYGLNRGLASGFLILTISAFFFHKTNLGFIFVFVTGMYLYRTYRFGLHYARELFVQFLAMNDTADKSRIEKNRKNN